MIIPDDIFSSMLQVIIITLYILAIYVIIKAIKHL